MLEALRTRVAEAKEPAARALALIELAEAEPIFGRRQAVVRPLLHEAAGLVDTLGDRSLEGRILLRLAYVKLVDADLEGTEQLASRARERLASDPYRVLEADVLSVRAGIRRHQFTEAERMIIQLGRDAQDDTSPLAARAGAALMIALVELALEQRNYADADARLDALEATVEADDTLLDQRFTAGQLRAAVALGLGKAERACHALRAIVVVAKHADALEDELEARIALAGTLIERGDPIGREEAERHLQITRDAAIEHGLDSLHMAALVGQAGVLAKKGQTQAALDRCVEIASSAASKRDLPRYAAAVALMSQIYEQKGDLASAYRTFAEAHATLRTTLGEAGENVLLPYISALAERVGHERFHEVVEAVNKAETARRAFRRT